MRTTWVAVAVVGLLVGAAAVAEGSGGGGRDAQRAPAPRRQEHLTDANILAMMKGGDSVEVVLSKWVRERTKNAALRSYTELLTRDHEKGVHEVETLASKVKIRPQAPPDDTTGLHDQHVQERLARLSGFDFDTAAARHWIRDHENDIKDTDRMIREATNAEVKRGAEKELPTLRKHLAAARRLESRLTHEHGESRETRKGSKRG